MKQNVEWTAIVLTCPSKHNALALQKEVDIWQAKGIIDEGVILLTVEDPSSQVGSGGATLNALLVVTEHICARQGYSIVNTDVLRDTYVLIFHLGRSFPCDGCGHAFVTLPLSRQQTVTEGLVTNLEVLLNMMTTRVAVNSSPGVWVCSTDMFLQVPHVLEQQWFAGVDVCAVSVPVSADYARKHGVYKISPEGMLEDIIYQGSEEAIKTCCLPTGLVPVVSGVVYLSAKIAEKMLMSPLNACSTYLGLDSGARPMQLSLFFDILLSMCSDVTREAFVSGERGGPYGRAAKTVIPQPDLQLMKRARRTVWQLLRGSNTRVAIVPDGYYSYMSCVSHREHILRLLDTRQSTWRGCKKTHSFVQSDVVSDDAVFINSIVDTDTCVGSGSVLSHTHLPRGMTVGCDSIISGVCSSDFQDDNFELPPNVVLQVFHISLRCLKTDVSQRVLTLFGREDDLHRPVTDPASTFCNRPWQHLFTTTGICKEDLWDTHVGDAGCCLFTARLFPFFHCYGRVDWRDVLWLVTRQDSSTLQRWRSSWRLSLKEILSNVDLAAEFDRRRRLYFNVAERHVRETLMKRSDRGLTGLYVSAVTEGYAHALLSVLDAVAIDCQSAGVAARTLANIACLLSCMARGRGGLQSGPAANLQWKPAMLLLEEKDTVRGVQMMATERGHWLDRPDLLIRAARHYEGAAQILIRHAVMTASQFITTTPSVPVPMETWVIAECPARIDISGGWSDTPPITYERGGVVINAAILLDGKKPIGAKVKRTERLELVLHLVNEGGDNTDWVISDLSQLADYSQPQAPGALLKAAFCCAGIVDFPSCTALSTQLAEKYGGGFELHSWSFLPHGSGLGTSSILAGAVIAVLWKASGRTFDISSLNHAVLNLEQMLTTGGGWQDQVGGIAPGIKITLSKPQLPLHIEVSFPPISADTVQAFSDRLLMVYTGKTRLAKNLLQNVIRNWYARDPMIVTTVDNLVTNARQCVRAFKQDDLVEVGKCMDTYWRQKKLMAPGCEPQVVAQMMALLQPHTLGCVMAGAGGGGFVYLLMKEPHMEGVVRGLIDSLQDSDTMTVHKASIDATGMTLTVEGEGRVHVNNGPKV